MCCRHGKTDLKGKSQARCYYDFPEENRGDTAPAPEGLAVWLGFIFLRHVAVDIDTV